MQYLSEKKKCFICNVEIESTEEKKIEKTEKNSDDVKMDI